MTKFNFALKNDEYTWTNALLWGNCSGHWKKIGTGSLGNSIVHIIIALVECLPIISQIASISEKLIVSSSMDKENSKPLSQKKVTDESKQFSSGKSTSGSDTKSSVESEKKKSTSTSIEKLNNLGIEKLSSSSEGSVSISSSQGVTNSQEEGEELVFSQGEDIDIVISQGEDGEVDIADTIPGLEDIIRERISDYRKGTILTPIQLLESLKSSIVTEILKVVPDVDVEAAIDKYVAIAKEEVLKEKQGDRIWKKAPIYVEDVANDIVREVCNKVDHNKLTELANSVTFPETAYSAYFLSKLNNIKDVYKFTDEGNAQKLEDFRKEFESLMQLFNFLPEGVQNELRPNFNSIIQKIADAYVNHFNFEYRQFKTDSEYQKTEQVYNFEKELQQVFSIIDDEKIIKSARIKIFENPLDVNIVNGICLSEHIDSRHKAVVSAIKTTLEFTTDKKPNLLTSLMMLEEMLEKLKGLSLNPEGDLYLEYYLSNLRGNVQKGGLHLKDALDEKTFDFSKEDESQMAKRVETVLKQIQEVLGMDFDFKVEMDQSSDILFTALHTVGYNQETIQNWIELHKMNTDLVEFQQYIANNSFDLSEEVRNGADIDSIYHEYLQKKLG